MDKVWKRVFKKLINVDSGVSKKWNIKLLKKSPEWQNVNL